MKTDARDLELLIEFMSLSSKYGKKRIEKLINLLRDPKTLEDTICILEKTINVISIENTPKDVNSIMFASISESNDTLGKINTLLKDTKVFRTIQDLDAVIDIFIKEGINTSKKKDKIEIFNLYLRTLGEEKLKEVLSEIINYRPKTKQKEIKSYDNDLSQWSDIIMKKNNY